MGNPMGISFSVYLLPNLTFDKSTEWKSYKWEFAGVLKWTIITMFLSFIPAYIDWNQSILLSLQASIKYTWILFYLFYSSKMEYMHFVYNEIYHYSIYYLGYY